MKLSVVIPVYNEAATIRDVVAAVKKSPVPDREIVVVDDGSTDGTAEIVRSELRDDVDLVLFHDRNHGKGAALRTAFARVGGDVVVIQDGDLELDPQQLPLLLEPIEAGKADVVFGSRFMGGPPHRVVFFWHMVGNRVLTLLSNMMTNINLTDMGTCYKMLRREVLDSITLEEDGFAVDAEITAKVARGGWRIYEVGISYSGRTYDQGKKIRWKDGARIVYAIGKYNLRRSG